MRSVVRRRQCGCNIQFNYAFYSMSLSIDFMALIQFQALPHILLNVSPLTITPKALNQSNYKVDPYLAIVESTHFP